MAAALVTGQVANATGTISASATLPNAPASGNLLVAFVQTQGGVGDVNPPAGWTDDKEQGYAAASGSAISIWHKVSAGTEQTSVWASLTGANMQVVVAEFSGASGTVDVSAGTADSGGNVSSIACAGTTTDAGALIAMCAGQSAGNGGTNAATNGAILSSAQNRLVPAFWVPGSAGAKTSTLSWATARRSGGLFVAFKAASTAVTSSDTGTAGTEGNTIAGAVSDADTAGGTDAGESVAGTATDTETGTGTDTEGTAQISGDGDAGTGTDAGEAVAATVSAPETGTATDVEAPTEQFTDPDTGASTETEAAAVTLLDDEAASATDSEATATAFADDDPGTGADAGEAVTASVADDDPSVITDTEAAAITVTDTETGTATDAGAVTAGQEVDDGDTGTGSDLEAAVNAALADADLSTAVDDAFAGASFTDDDQALIAEGAVILLLVAGTETGTAAEAQNVVTNEPGGGGWLVGASFL